ncbi:MAG: phosphatidylinositol kinase [Acidobacteriia bacterium]|nr:phosphatidylinositol kinase [Terriglobia bacterium]
MAVEAVQHVRRMRGGAQAHLMRADDGHFYVVKFQNNPQHLRVLANELLATRLAESIGLPVPVTEIIEVREWLVENTLELHMDLAGLSSRCKPGLQFGARYVCDPAEGQVFDYLPESMMSKVKNLAVFAGMLVADKWLGNANGRQAVFWKKTTERKYTATFIDQGYCFNAGEWNFPDSALRGVYARNFVYQQVTGWESFEPWLSRVENLAPAAVQEIAGAVPPEWAGNDWGELENLVENIIERRSKVRELITAFRNSSRQPFPAWGMAAPKHEAPANLM